MEPALEGAAQLRLLGPHMLLQPDRSSPHLVPARAPLQAEQVCHRARLPAKLLRIVGRFVAPACTAAATISSKETTEAFTQSPLPLVLSDPDLDLHDVPGPCPSHFSFREL